MRPIGWVSGVLFASGFAVLLSLLPCGKEDPNSRLSDAFVTPEVEAAESGRVPAYNPPSPQEAPAEIKDAVMLGYRIMMETGKYAGQYVGNKLACANCHFQGGITKGGKNGGLSLVGVAVKYPKYRERAKGIVDLLYRTNSCFERSMNGKPLPPGSKELVAVVTYYHWISKGLPIYGEVPWLGLKHLESGHKPDGRKGKKVFGNQCAVCHGTSGQGTEIGPPLWGEESFNDGAGMAHAGNLAAFVHLNMPRNNPDLSVDQSLDVAACVTAQPRPRFTGK